MGPFSGGSASHGRPARCPWNAPRGDAMLTTDRVRASHTHVCLYVHTYIQTNTRIDRYTHARTLLRTRRALAAGSFPS